MLRGVRRLFAVLAVGWVMLTIWVFLSDPGSLSGGAVFQIIVFGGAVIYGAGWLATYLANGFKKPRGRIIDQ